jgi:hypothetical protein
MKHELRIVFDDETKIVEVKPEHILTDRGLCYMMLGFANEIVTRNGLAAPAFKPETKPAGATYGVQPCRTIITPPED